MWNGCIQAAQILNLLYNSGIQLMPRFYCNSTSPTNLLITASTRNVYDNTLFWNNFGTSPNGLIPAMTSTGES